MLLPKILINKSKKFSRKNKKNLFNNLLFSFLKTSMKFTFSCIDSKRFLMEYQFKDTKPVICEITALSTKMKQNHFKLTVELEFNFCQNNT